MNGGLNSRKLVVLRVPFDDDSRAHDGVITQYPGIGEAVQNSLVKIVPVWFPTMPRGSVVTKLSVGSKVILGTGENEHEAGSGGAIERNSIPHGLCGASHDHLPFVCGSRVVHASVFSSDASSGSRLPLWVSVGGEY